MLTTLSCALCHVPRLDLCALDATRLICQDCLASLLSVVESQAMTFVGIVRVRALPRDCSEQDFKAWWPRLDDKERDKWTVAEHRNLLTSAGRSLALNFFGSASSVQAFAMQFSVGTGNLLGVSPGDTSIVGELYRSAPTSYNVVGTQVTISTYFAAATAQGLWTNAGLYGQTATGTLGSGVLMTHTMYNFDKQSTPITNDYVIGLQ